MPAYRVASTRLKAGERGERGESETEEMIIDNQETKRGMDMEDRKDEGFGKENISLFLSCCVLELQPKPASLLKWPCELQELARSQRR